jgi:hypothetical protein
MSNQTDSKKTKKEIETATKQAKDTFTNDYVHLFQEETLVKLFTKELCNFAKYIDEKVKAWKEFITTKAQEMGEAVKFNEKKCRENVIKNLSMEDYEKIYPETTTYIKSNIFHGYDSMFYVLNKNCDGHILPLEYNYSNFNSTFYKYFPENIRIWFDKYYIKHVLTIDNTKDRCYKLDDTNYLNLFAGFRFNRKEERDTKRIKAGQKGVQFIWNHIKCIWNSNNEVNFKYDQNWIRKLMSGYKLCTMLYLKGKMGQGKTIIVNFLKQILGMHICLTLSYDSPFMTEFNGSLLGKAFVCLDEIVHDFDSFKSLYNKLKPYITDHTMSYRNLYERLKQLLNMNSFIMTGNYDMLN